MAIDVRHCQRWRDHLEFFSPGQLMAILIEIETPHRLLQITHVRMFHAKAVARWRGIVAAAHEKMGGVRSGIGFIGSAGWVVAGSLVLGAIEGALSSSNAKEGLRMLGQAGLLMSEIQTRGIFVPVSDIVNIGIPKPAAWQTTQKEISFITLDEEFLPVITEGGDEVMLRWDAIISFRCC